MWFYKARDNSHRATREIKSHTDVIFVGYESCPRSTEVRPTLALEA